MKHRCFGYYHTLKKESEMKVTMVSKVIDGKKLYLGTGNYTYIFENTEAAQQILDVMEPNWRDEGVKIEEEEVSDDIIVKEEHIEE